MSIVSQTVIRLPVKCIKIDKITISSYIIRSLNWSLDFCADLSILIHFFLFSFHPAKSIEIFHIATYCFSWYFPTLLQVVKPSSASSRGKKEDDDCTPLLPNNNAKNQRIVDDQKLKGNRTIYNRYRTCSVKKPVWLLIANISVFILIWSPLHVCLRHAKREITA